MSQSDFLSKATAEYEAAFELIDAIFSLEFCLRYQVLPLELSDNHLIVGMVDPKDKIARQEFISIINSFKYSFHIQSIDAQIHQLVLVAYLKQGNFNKSLPQKSVKSSQIAPNQNQKENISEARVTQKSLDHAGTLIDIPQESLQKSLDYAGTLIDIPQESLQKSLDHAGTLIDIPQESLQKSLDHAGTLIDIPQEVIPNYAQSNLHERPTFIVNDTAEKSFDNQERSNLFFSEPQINNLEDENKILNIKANDFAKPIDFYQNSPPDILWQELLVRILAKGIGRLYLQQCHHYGRIICSQDGVVQSSLEKVPFAILEGVIKEIKMMAKLPLAKLDKSKKVAIQQFYNHEKVLLRIEFILGKFGEEITIQVLRGQALNFYEQRQISKSLDQAIYLGQKLEKILKKMRICQSSVNTSDLSTLKVIMRQVEKQLKLLES